MFQAKTAAVLNQQNKVQELVVRAVDTHLYQISGGVVYVTMGEAMSNVVSCLFHDNSAATLTSLTAANLVISDSTALTAGGDAKTVKCTGVAALDANDNLIIKYIVT